MIYYLLLLIGLSSGGFTPNDDAHDFHISQTRIEYEPTAREWQISLHLFIDDLETALAAKSVPVLHLGTQKESAEADAYLLKYLQRYFQIQQQDQLLEYEWLGKEVTEDLSAFWVYLYVSEAEAKGVLKLKNQLLMEQFDDQQNIIQLRAPDAAEHYFLFHQDDFQATIMLD